MHIINKKGEIKKSKDHEPDLVDRLNSRLDLEYRSRFSSLDL